ncbi:MAG: DsrE/DsrF/TusD sulfur relay family protein [Candidatus Hydrothermarchaeales archaeon]
MAKTLTILLNRGPYESEYADLAVNFALKAKEKGHNVNLYLYCDGVWVPHVKEPKSFPNVGERLRQALKRGVNVKICARCAEAREVIKGDIIEGIPLVGLFDFIDWLKESNKVITFSR